MRLATAAIMLLVAENSTAGHKDDDAYLFVANAKAAVVQQFNDPLSAQFSDLVISENKVTHQKVLCGQVNAKNLFGGYVGFAPFHVKAKGTSSKVAVVWIGNAKVRLAEIAKLEDYDQQKAERASLRTEYEVSLSLCTSTEINIIRAVK